MRDAFSRTLYKIAKKNSKIFIAVADISPAASMAQFREEFPERFINVGVSEQCMIGLCAGLAMRGCTVFAYTIAPFAIYRPFEQIRIDLCYQNVPVTVVGVGGGASYSTLGGTHHTLEDISIMTSLPNMSVIAPCDPLETESATLACSFIGPCYLRIGKAGEPTLTADAVEPFRFGRLRYLKKGKDFCIFSYGPIMKLAFEVAKKLEKSGFTVSVVSVHTLKPLDKHGVIEALISHSSIAVIEEHTENNGLSAKLKQIAWEIKADSQLLTFGLKDQFIHVYGSQQDIWRAHGLDIESIVDRISYKF